MGARDNPAPFETPFKEAPKAAEPSIINPNSGSRASAPSSGSRAKRPRSDSREHRPAIGKPVINVSEDKTKSLPAKSVKSVVGPVGEPNPYANVVPPKQVKSSSEVEQSKQKSSNQKKNQKNISNPYESVRSQGEGSQEKMLPEPRVSASKKAAPRSTSERKPAQRPTSDKKGKKLIMGPHNPAGDEILQKFKGQNKLKPVRQPVRHPVRQPVRKPARPAVRAPVRHKFRSSGPREW